MELTIPLGFGRKIGMFNAFELNRQLAEKSENPALKLWCCFSCLLHTGRFTVSMKPLERQIQNQQQEAKSFTLISLCWANQLLSEVKVAINLFLYCITKLATVQDENQRDVLYLSTVSEKPFCTSPSSIHFFFWYEEKAQGYSSMHHWCMSSHIM